MTIGYYQGEIRDLRGNALVNAVVDVFNAGTVTPATLFSDAAGTVPLTSSPLAAAAGLARPGKDAAGNVTFFADDALEYDVRVTDASGVVTFRARVASGGGGGGGPWEISDTTGLQPALDAKVEPPVVGDAVFYVADNGDDDDDGLSWGKAKATPAAALTAGARKLIFGKGTFPCSAITTSLRNIVVEGVGQGETILDFTGLSGSQIAFDLSAGGPTGARGSTIQNLTILGPGDVTTTGANVVGIKCYDGFAPRNVEVVLFGLGIDLDTGVGIWIDRSVEIRACGMGWRVLTNGNKNHIDARVLGCVNGCTIDSNEIILNGWFENCTSTEITIKDCNAVHMSDLWIEQPTESGRTAPSIVLLPDSVSFPNPLVVTLRNSFITQPAGSTYFMEIHQAQSVVLDGIRFNDDNYAAVKITGWVMNLEDRGCYVSTPDTETDGGAALGVRVPLRVLGPGKVYSVSMPGDLANLPFNPSDDGPWIGGFANAASTNLVTDSSFETALNATGNGASAPTVTDDADAYWGTHSCKAVFAGATVGSGGYLRLDKNIAATSGGWYVIQFFAKANKAFRGITFRMFNVTSGSFETLFLPYIDLGTTYRRHRILWQAPATANFRLSWYKTAVTTNAISLWVDDVAVWAGSVPGVYVPQRSTAVAKGAAAADTLVLSAGAEVGGTTQTKRLKGGVGGTALVAGDFVLSAGWGTTASVSAISATDHGGKFQVNAAGTGFAADCTVTMTFKDGAWPVAPVAIVKRNGGNGTVEATWTTTTTTMVLSYSGVPINGGVYIFNFVAL